MNLSIRLSDADARLVKSYAEVKGMSVSDVLRSAVMEKIEDEIDIELARKALEEYEANPITFSHEEVGRMLGLK